MPEHGAGPGAEEADGAAPPAGAGSHPEVEPLVDDEASPAGAGPHPEVPPPPAPPSASGDEDGHEDDDAAEDGAPPAPPEYCPACAGRHRAHTVRCQARRYGTLARVRRHILKGGSSSSSGRGSPRGRSAFLREDAPLAALPEAETLSRAEGLERRLSVTRLEEATRETDRGLDELREARADAGEPARKLPRLDAIPEDGDMDDQDALAAFAGVMPAPLAWCSSAIA